MQVAARMSRGGGLALVAALLLHGAPLTPGGGPASAAPEGSRWGANYFPNVPLVTHEGETVRFYDLIKDRVVAINFIFTSCGDVCPAETAKLREVQKLLGDRVGDDIFMYSISIDPKTDTPEVLKAYREKFRVGPGWVFLTGEEADIALLQKKLGLFINEADPQDHNVSLIVGNEATGRWMKRSPFDKPQVLAMVIGDWLHNWKFPGSAPKTPYADAPRLEKFTRGEFLFRARCSSCHAFGGGGALGPDLLGVTERRELAWLTRWLKSPSQLIEEGDPIATKLLARYNGVPMPDFSLTDVDVAALIEFMEAESRRLARQSAPEGHAHAHH